MSELSGYFDHNATTPLCEAAREAWLRAQSEAWQNPSSLYRSAGRVRRLLEDAREEMAGLLDCDPARIVFTSGATEGNNAVLRSVASVHGAVAISPVEHPAVTEPAFQSFGSERVCVLTADAHGRVDPSQVDELPEEVSLVSVMAANNETGVVQPWHELAVRCAGRGLAFHCDAAQWVGKRPLHGLCDCAWVTLSAHKFGGPKGVAALLVPEDQSLPLRLQSGGPQEFGHRGGTEDYAGISAMLAALKARQAWLEKSGALDSAASLRDAFELRLLASAPGIVVVGADAPRLELTSMVIMPEHSNLKWVTRLGERGLCVSTGSACSSGKGNPSPVLQAMGLDFDAMGRVLRFSAGPETTAEDWESLLIGIVEVRDQLASGSTGRPQLDLGRL